MIVMVTGASRGIGRAVVKRVVETHNVVGVYRRDHDAARSLLTHLEEKDHALAKRCTMLNANLANQEGIEQIVHAVEEPLGAVVFNAGIAIRGSFSDGAALRTQIDFDLWAPLELCRRLLVENKIADGASLVFLSSNLARHGLTEKVAYSAAKAGLEGAVRGLAKELGPRGIRVNAIAPGLLQTDMTADLPAEAIQEYTATVPLGRIGAAQDIAGVAEFFISDASNYVSGQVLDVDGGWGC